MNRNAERQKQFYEITERANSYIQKIRNATYRQIYIYLYTYIFQEFVVYHPRQNSKIYTNARDNAKNFAANPNTSVYKKKKKRRKSEAENRWEREGVAVEKCKLARPTYGPASVPRYPASPTPWKT